MQLHSISNKVIQFPVSTSDRQFIESVKRGLERQDYLHYFSAEQHYLAMRKLLRKLSLYDSADVNHFTKDWQLRNVKNEVQQLCQLLRHQINMARFK